MSSKWILLFFAIALIQSVVTESDIETGNVADENVSESGHKIAELNTSHYFRLFNVQLGREYALDIDEVSSRFVPKMAPFDKNRQSQFWRFVSVGNNIYQIQNYAKNGLSLIYDGDFQDLKIFFAETTETVYQYWSAFLFENRQYKFFSRNLNEEQFLTVPAENLYVHMSATGSNDFGQRWTLESVDKVDEQ